MRHPFDGINPPAPEELSLRDTPSPSRRTVVARLFAVAAGTLTALLGRSASAQSTRRRRWGQPTTYALGEEGATTFAVGEEGGYPPPWSTQGVRPTTRRWGESGGRPTTYATGEEGGATTFAIGEEGGATTFAIGEEGGTATTYAVGEEGGNATTFALGEEGGVTTFAVGEEGGGVTSSKRSR